jgi:lysozyme family protein
MSFFERLYNAIASRLGKIFGVGKADAPSVRGPQEVVRKVEPKPEPKVEPVKKSLDDLSKLEEGTAPFYRMAYDLCEVYPGYDDAVASNVKTVLKGKARYEKVASKVGIPWWVIGCIHFKEASCSFAGVLHNGEKIIGTGKKTKLVPKGRGPFESWEEAAIDAITLNGGRWAKLKAGSKDIGNILYACERFNGTGYITGAGKAQRSPYLWARSNICLPKGKYVSDGKYDATATTLKTTGIALLIKGLVKLGEAEIS